MSGELPMPPRPVILQPGRPAAEAMTGRVLRIETCPYGPRVYLLGRRVHHGMSGLIAAVLGVAAMIHDRRDAPWVR